MKQGPGAALSFRADQVLRHQFRNSQKFGREKDNFSLRLYPLSKCHNNSNIYLDHRHIWNRFLHPGRRFLGPFIYPFFPPMYSIDQMHNCYNTVTSLITSWFGSVCKNPLMHKGELLLEKGELKHRDALLFAQGYKHLSDLLKRVWINHFCGVVCLNGQTLLFFFLSISYSGNLERTVKIHLARELVFIGSWIIG